MLIAIDGPSGAGKGTVARAISEALQCRHVDTGAMYRAVAWRAADLGVSLDDEPAVADVARAAALRAEQGRVEIDGHDVTRAIRTPEMDAAAARVARLGQVRQVLVERQRDYAASGDLVMEGRDIGTVVLPQADVKVYLDASPDERARRRAGDAAHAANGGDVATIASALAQRDHSDKSRTVSPLTLAPDAVYIDTTGLPIADVVDQVLALVRAAQARG
ncbi:cytidylate kinase [Luteitalea sp. TBR-22]|uniref:(d)CMP kinase n=1 Tax=Luteitalea sp. TBR-22 TaxID=2802971 RepID=UPI001AF1503E|nr:(d)CMP kinase [Luteitalea sp. TBR-22]BCS34200.1 cytidylate kinase [Luteitalea sp. TBR-22]